MRIYFMGICGTAMGNAALLMKAQGHEVFGSDSAVYPPMCDVLGDAGIKILEGFDGQRLEAIAPELVVVGNAVSRGNPEVEWLLEQTAIPFVSLPQLFHDRLLPGRLPIVITGTHGKTTTSTIAAYLLERAGQVPGWLIGGVPHDLKDGAKLGKGVPFVIEGDEYDSAFFDKRSKFIHYRPRVVVLNNLEFDHADIFRDLADIQRSFSHLLKIIPASGYALLNGDDPNLEALLPVDWTQVLRVGCGEKNDLRIVDFEDQPRGSRFELWWHGRRWAEVAWSLHGLFNARNAAMAALAASLGSGIAPEQFDLAPLASFRGVRRRQEILFDRAGWTVIEDFAHHPTAVSGTIEALRAAYPGRVLTACFEPRSNTAASHRFQESFSRALGGADSVFLGAVHRADRLRPEERLDTEAIAAWLRTEGLNARAFPSNVELYEAMEARLRTERSGLVVFFSNGSFDGLAKKTADHLADG